MSRIWNILVDAVNAPASKSTNCWNGVKPKKFSITEQTLSSTSSLRQNCGKPKDKNALLSFLNTKFISVKPNDCICTQFTTAKMVRIFSTKYIFSGQLMRSSVYSQIKCKYSSCCIGSTIFIMIWRSQRAGFQLENPDHWSHERISSQSYLNILSSWQTV